MSHKVKSHSLSFYNIMECPGGPELLLKMLTKLKKLKKRAVAEQVPRSLLKMLTKLKKRAVAEQVPRSLENSNVIPLFRTPTFDDFVKERISKNIFLELNDLMEYIEEANIDNVGKFKNWSKNIDGKTLINIMG